MQGRDAEAYTEFVCEVGTRDHYAGFDLNLLHRVIELGDEVLVQTTRGVDRYAVSDIRIVDKHDHSVLEETEDKRLTLVTCYPFYYAGHAPKRFIVTALPVAGVPESIAE